MKLFSFSTLLTLGRLIISPLVLPVLLVYLLPQNIFFINGILALLFVLLSLTGFFDDFLARRFNQVTKLGKQLDPIAQQFFSYATLVALVAADKIFFYWAIIFMASDFFVIGLRAIARKNDFELQGSFWDRLKSIGMLVYLAFLILNPYHLRTDPLQVFNNWNLIELLLLGVAFLLSFITCKRYYDEFVKQYGPIDKLFGDSKKVETIDPDWPKDDKPE